MAKGHNRIPHPTRSPPPSSLLAAEYDIMNKKQRYKEGIRRGYLRNRNRKTGILYIFLTILVIGMLWIFLQILLLSLFPKIPY
ncbi:MAG: hypothetical protein ACFFDI_24155 [Promethearchaeota archaeon]